MFEFLYDSLCIKYPIFYPLLIIRPMFESNKNRVDINSELRLLGLLFQFAMSIPAYFKNIGCWKIRSFETLVLFWWGETWLLGDLRNNGSLNKLIVLMKTFTVYNNVYNGTVVHRMFFHKFFLQKPHSKNDLSTSYESRLRSK